jgi:hypothetical protein
LQEAERREAAIQTQTANHSDTDGVLLNPNGPSKPLERTPSSTGDLLIQPSNNMAQKTPTLSKGLSSNSISVESYTLVQGQILSKYIEANHASPLYSAEDSGHSPPLAGPSISTSIAGLRIFLSAAGQSWVGWP